MAKNIVLCCDGTANQFAIFNTNVVKLYSVLVHNDARQRTMWSVLANAPSMPVR